MKRLTLLALLLLATACGSGELTSEQAQALLDAELGEGVAQVVGVRNESEQEAIARVELDEGAGTEIDVKFALFDTGWRPGEVEMMGQSFPIAQLLGAVDRGRQRRTMAHMRNIATANGTMRVDIGNYATSLSELSPEYMENVPTTDAWGNPFVYSVEGDGYRITSLGSDGQLGPAPQRRWQNEPYEPDIILRDGQFIQAPSGR